MEGNIARIIAGAAAGVHEVAARGEARVRQARSSKDLTGRGVSRVEMTKSARVPIDRSRRRR